MKKTYVITGIFVPVLLVFLFILLFIGEKVTLNPLGTLGNTAGNLNNSGLFCEHDGVVYFANSYDNGSLYSMTPSEGNLKKIHGVEVCNILAGGDYLYYFRIGEGGDAGLGTIRSVKSFNRCKLNGTDTVSLTRDTIVSAQLIDNYLYMLAAGNAHPEFYKMKIDKSEKIVLADYVINPACAENGIIYYNGTQNDHYLHGLDTSTDVSHEVWRGNLWNPIKDGDYIYYMDVTNNYRLCRYSLSQDVVEVLTNDRIECFNIGSGYIYYQCGGNSPALKCMLTDGSSVQTIAEGNYTNINMTSQYVYFQEFGNDIAIYHSLLGTSGYSSFDASRTAAMTE